ncbi:hypothetical protein HDU76_013687 [Blyttiomyces sp. JEL0837]|nr:hypothetical protein HDU76_013687 [Blyttiomyces sp. JEL0837]
MWSGLQPVSIGASDMTSSTPLVEDGGQARTKRITSAQREVLEQSFVANQFSAADQILLCKSLQLTSEQVKKWFARRSKKTAENAQGSTQPDLGATIAAAPSNISQPVNGGVPHMVSWEQQMTMPGLVDARQLQQPNFQAQFRPTEKHGPQSEDTYKTAVTSDNQMEVDDENEEEDDDSDDMQEQESEDARALAELGISANGILPSNVSVDAYVNCLKVLGQDSSRSLALAPLLDNKTPSSFIKRYAYTRKEKRICLYGGQDSLLIGPLVNCSFMNYKGNRQFDILRQWLLDSKNSESDLQVRILNVLAKLPFDVDLLKVSKLGKHVKVLAESNKEEVKNLATKLKIDWMGLVDKAQAAKAAPAESSAKRPRTDESATSKPMTAPAKKVKVVEESSKRAPTHEPTVMLEDNFDLFQDKSVVPEKPRLQPQSLPKMKFKKTEGVPHVIPVVAAPVSATRTTPAADEGDLVAEDILLRPTRDVSYRRVETPEEKLQSENAQMEEDGVEGEAPVIPVNEDAPSTTDGKKGILKSSTSRRRGHRVVFAKDLEHVKYFTVEDEGAEPSKGKMSARESERGEGRKAFKRDLKPTIEWLTPTEISVGYMEKGQLTMEAKVQEERERTTMAQTYYTVAEIPRDPIEPDDAMLQLAPHDTWVIIPLDEIGDLEQPPMVMDQSHLLQNNALGLGALSPFIAGFANNGNASAPPPIDINQLLTFFSQQQSQAQGLPTNPAAGATIQHMYAQAPQMLQDSFQRTPPYQQEGVGNSSMEYSQGGSRDRDDDDDDDESDDDDRHRDYGDYDDRSRRDRDSDRDHPRRSFGGRRGSGDREGRGRGSRPKRGKRERPENIKPRGICQFWKRGNCQFGSGCFNKHEGEGGSSRQ